MSFRILQNFERISKSCDNIEGERLKHYYLQRWFLKSQINISGKYIKLDKIFICDNFGDLPLSLCPVSV